MYKVLLFAGTVEGRTIAEFLNKSGVIRKIAKIVTAKGKYFLIIPFIIFLRKNILSQTVLYIILLKIATL